MSEQTYDEWDLLEHFGDALIALEEVKHGGIPSKLESEFPETSPLGALYRGINEMIEALNAEQMRRRAYKVVLENRLAMIESQRSSIRALSMPIIEIWEGVLCLPVVGALDGERSEAMTATLLPAVVEKKAACVLVDVTGIQIMDATSIDAFLRMARSVRLLGAEFMLTGVHAKLAQAMLHLGVDVSDLVTFRNLRSALASYLTKTAAR